MTTGSVEVRGLSKRFPLGSSLRRRSNVHAVDDVSFELRPGTITALVVISALNGKQVPSARNAGVVVLGTALAQIILYRVLRSDGAARVSLVTYLLPMTALIYGVLLLGEPLTWEELAGMVLILGGVALGSGALRLAGRRPAVQEP